MASAPPEAPTHHCLIDSIVDWMVTRSTRSSRRTRNFLKNSPICIGLTLGLAVGFGTSSPDTGGAAEDGSFSPEIGMPDSFPSTYGLLQVIPTVSLMTFSVHGVLKASGQPVLAVCIVTLLI